MITSITGSHSPYIDPALKAPHVHLEVVKPNVAKPLVNNHVPTTATPKPTTTPAPTHK